MTKYYLDTCILIDYYEKRGTNGEIALILINKINHDKDLAIYSDLHIIELKRLGYSYKEVNSIFRIFFNTIKVHINKNQIDEANRLVKYLKIPRKDALHAILSRDNESILVSHDAHFQLLKYLINIKRPLELIEFSF